MAEMAGTSDYEELVALLTREGIFRSPSNIHGKICGYLTARVDLEGARWLDSLAQDLGIAGGIAPDVADVLLRLGEVASSRLSMRDFSFTLLLPDDDAPLNERAWEVGQWCAGYVDALHAEREERVNSLPESAGELLEDLEQISGISDDAEEDEENELDLVELVEYVRLAAIDLFDEFGEE